MSYLSAPDSILMTLSKEGRNLLARKKFGSELVYRPAGWQLGRGGYIHSNPVKIEPIVDNATESVGYIEVLDNSDWEAGDQIVLNGKSFIRGVNWSEGPTIQETVINIVDAIQSSNDTRVNRLINADVDPMDDTRIRITSTVTGNVLAGRTLEFTPADVNTTTDEITMVSHGFAETMMVRIATTGTLPAGISGSTDYFLTSLTADTFKLSTTLNAPTIVDITTPGTGTHSIVPTGNLYPLNHLETTGLGDTVNFLVTPMSLAESTTLIDPAYPVPPTLGAFTLPDGRVEQPTTESVSFVMRVPDGAVGMNAYGEIGVWVEILLSNHPMEIGRKVLFAHGHFPIFAKSDRTLATFRTIILF